MDGIFNKSCLCIFLVCSMVHVIPGGLRNNRYEGTGGSVWVAGEGGSVGYTPPCVKVNRISDAPPRL